MQDQDGSWWTIDPEAFRGLPGGPEVEAWFGFVPSFHDATLERLELAARSAVIVLNAFRMTGEVDAADYFELDRRARVTLRLDGVTGARLEGDATATVHELAIRQIAGDCRGWRSVAGPRPGDWEVRWDSSYGLEGAIYARVLLMELEPVRGITP